MIILLPLLAKLSIRSRVIAGRVLVVVGVAAVLVGLAAIPAIVIEAAITALVGGVFLGGAWYSRRSAARERAVVAS